MQVRTYGKKPAEEKVRHHIGPKTRKGRIVKLGIILIGIDSKCRYRGVSHGIVPKYALGQDLALAICAQSPLGRPIELGGLYG